MSLNLPDFIGKWGKKPYTRFDIGMKLIFFFAPNEMARFLLRKLGYDILRTELKAIEYRHIVSKRADIVFQSFFKTEENILKDIFVHVEVQSSNKPYYWRDMAVYNVLLQRLLGVREVQPFVLYVGEAPCKINLRFQNEYMSFNGTVIDFNKVLASELLQNPSIYMRLLSIYSHEYDNETLARHLAYTIAQHSTNPQEVCEILEILEYLLVPRTLVIFHMITSILKELGIELDYTGLPTYEFGKQEGKEKGIEEGRKEGRKEGKEEERIFILSQFIKDNTISLDEATQKFNLTPQQVEAIKKQITLNGDSEH